MKKSNNTTEPTTVAAIPVKKTKKLMPIEDYIAKINGNEEGEEGENKEGGLGIIEQILALYIKGYTRKEIVKAGFNRSTVYRQTGEFNKMKKAPIMQYFGYEMYEARVQRIMKSKGLSRAKAVEHIAQMDMEG